MFFENQIVLLPKGTTLIRCKRGENTSHIGLDLAVFTTASSMSKFYSKTGILCNKWITANCNEYPLMPYEKAMDLSTDKYLGGTYGRIVLRKDVRVKICSMDEYWYRLYYPSRRLSRGSVLDVGKQAAPIGRILLEAIALPDTKSN